MGRPIPLDAGDRPFEMGPAPESPVLHRRVIACLCSALALTSAGVARAQPAEEPIRIEYAAPPTCPPESAFFAQLRARTSRVTRAATGARARTFAVTVVPRGRRIAGHLVIRDPDGATAAERDVAGDTCEEVVEALALVTALSVDPGAVTRAHVGPTP
ncbi:MAG: hypothetical protein ACRELB_06170, partial [Polyangiaceae bacterium]